MTLLGQSLNRRSYSDLVTRVDQGSVIPRILIQTFSSKLSLPNEARTNIAALKALNPHWDYRFFDDDARDAFVEKHYGIYVAKQLRRINADYGPARADLFRYLVLYRCGGVYLDVKGMAHKPLDEILKPTDAFLLSQWDNGKGSKFEDHGIWPELRAVPGGEYQQWFIATVPGHPFLREVIGTVLANIDAYNPVLHGTGKRAVLRLTGPIPYTLAIQRLKDTCPHRQVRNERDLHLEYSTYGPNTVLAKTHYSQLVEPVVSVSSRWTIPIAIYVALKKLRRQLLAMRAQRLTARV